MAGSRGITKASNSRVFLTKNRAGPANAPQYRGRSAAQGFTWPQGALTPVRVPSASRYGEFDIVDTIQAAQDLPTLPVMFRDNLGASDILEKVRTRCPLDLEIHFGECRNAEDFATGWHDGHILVVEDAHFTDYNTSVLGAIDDSVEAVVDETATFTGLDAYQIVTLQPSAQADAEVTDPIIAVVICDSISCGSCGLPSDGCEKVFALTSGVAGSPGLALEIIWSSDKGKSYNETNINSAALGDLGVALACVGERLVAVTDQDAYHYVDIDDIINGTDSWTQVTTGFVAAGSPNAVVSAARDKTWFAGDLGYIYISTDITAGVTVQTAGDVVSDNLNDIHCADEVLVAVGASNAVLLSENEGASWSSITGPAVGVDLTSVEVISALVWFVGDASGDLWYTVDGGTNWTQKTITGATGTDDILDIAFVNQKVGYLARGTEVYRTISGGNSWVLSPEDTTFAFPTNTVINSIGVCSSQANLYFAGGANASDGVLVKAIGAGLS